MTTGEVDFLVIPAVPWEGFVPICMVAQPSLISFTRMSQDVSTTAGRSNASWGNVSHIRFVQQAAAISISDCKICPEIMICVCNYPE